MAAVSVALGHATPVEFGGVYWVEAQPALTSLLSLVRVCSLIAVRCMALRMPWLPVHPCCYAGITVIRVRTLWFEACSINYKAQYRR